MAYLAGLIFVFLVAFGPNTCQAQSIIIRQVYRYMNEIDTVVQAANVDAATYVTELHRLFENLNTSASTDLSSLGRTSDNLISSIKSEIASLVTNAGDNDVSKCTDLSASVISNANEILENVINCISPEVSQAEEEVALSVRYVDFQLNILANYQSFAEHCIVRLNESEQTSSDAAQALACVQPLHRSVQLFMYRFEFIIDIELAKDLFSGFENRVAICSTTGSNELNSLASTAKSVTEEISNCIAGTVNSSS